MSKKNKKDKKKDSGQVTEEAFIIRDGQAIPLSAEAYIGRNYYPDDDEPDWVGYPRGTEPTFQELKDSLDCTREKIECNPYLRRALKLYMDYILGSDFMVSAEPRKPVGKEYPDKQKDRDIEVASIVSDMISELHEANAKSWTPNELVKRVYRDGETFTRKYPDKWPMPLRFLDFEEVGDTPATQDKGIITDPNDVTVVSQYRRIDPYKNNEEKELIPADRIVHTKIDVDANVKRGKSRFSSLMQTIKRLDTFVDTEVTMRNLQASIVIVRKVNGSPQSARFLLDNSKTGTKQVSRDITINKERIGSGSIATAPAGTDLEFKQPNTNYSDASPIASLLMKQISAVTGWTYQMISSDTGEGNLANSLVQETPVLQMVNAERLVLKPDLLVIYKSGVNAAIGRSEKYRERLSAVGIESAEQFWDEYKLCFKYGEVVTRDLTKLSQAYNLMCMNGAASSQEFSRAVGLDADKMVRERQEEAAMKTVDGLPLYNRNVSNQNPDTGDISDSSASNAAGKNSDGKSAVKHKDGKGVGGSQNT